MKLNWNFVGLAILAAIGLFGAGCGGINTGATVSPASFFIPGLLRNDPPTNAPVASLDISREFASVK